MLCLAQTDPIERLWYNDEKSAKIQVYKAVDGKFYGKIVWLKEPIDPKTGKPKTDIEHPDEKLHSRPVLGLVNLWGFIYKPEGTWENGHIYDPKNGKEYKCVITKGDNNTLNVRGYIGITLIGRTDTWKRSAL